MKGYLELETEDIVEQTKIGLNTLELRIGELNHVTKDYASRDNTYYFFQNNLRHFINDLISTSSFVENEINFMIFIDNQKEIRLAHHNPIVKKVYQEFLTSQETIHHICHTKYSPKEKEVKT